MLRTIEVIFVILILSGAFIAASYLAVLPAPQEVSPINLRRLSFTTLQMLDSDFDLGKAAFETENATMWGRLQISLSASLPANILYNLTVYNVNGTGNNLYTKVSSFSNADGIIGKSDVATYTVASSNVTYSVIPDKILQQKGGTLYILNCSDASGWWITGYTAHSLAQDLYNMLSPYFVKTVMIQNTTQLYRILNGNPIGTEAVEHAVVINTCGEAVPIPSAYATQYSSDYGQYTYLLGQKVRTFNWTWASIVGYPFYYVSNTASFSGGQNNWGIYGMQQIAGKGSITFLKGLDNQTYGTTGTTVAESNSGRQVTLTQGALEACNYYGIYPSQSQTSTRAITGAIQNEYNLSIGTNILNPVSGYYPGTLYTHGTANISGSFLALGLTRTPDIRLTAISLLSYYQPRVYALEYTASGTSRLVVLQLGLAGGN